MDLFSQDGIPDFTRTAEFASMLSRKLRTNGVLVANTWDSKKEKMSELLNVYKANFHYISKVVNSIVT